MSVTQTCLWISLVFCIARGGSEIIFEKSGNDVTLDCGDASSGQDVTWKNNNSVIIKVFGKDGRNQKGLAFNSRTKLQVPKLFISSLGERDSGKYSCTGYDIKGNKVEKEHSLNIVSVSGNTAVVLHSELTLKCHVTGNSKAHVEWLRPNSISYGTRTDVRVNSVKLGDAGKWICQIKDEKQVERLKMDVTITVVGLVQSAEEVSVHPGGAATLQCCLSDQSILRIVGGGWTRHSQTSYFLALDRQKDLRWNTGAEMSKFTLPKPPLTTNFSVILQNVQSADAGVYVCTLMFEGGKNLSARLNLKVEGEAVVSGNTFLESSIVGVKFYIWVAIVTGSTLLIVLFVIIVIFHRRNKRSRRKVRKLKSMREPLTPRKYCQCNSAERLPCGGRRERPPPLPRTEYYHGVS